MGTSTTSEPAGWMFTVGKKVEVSFEKERLRDVWFPATVLKNSGNSTFLVEYQQPGAGDKEILHEVTVDYQHIRPSPPHLKDKNFVLLEKVDAYYDFGWWCGVITKELADNRYTVFIKHTKKQQEFIYSDVRPHMEWKGGKWFNTSQKGDMAVRTTHSSINNQIGHATPIIGKQSPVAISVLKRERQDDLDSNDKTSPNDKNMNDDSVIKKKHPSINQSVGINSEVSEMNDQAFDKKGDMAVWSTQSLIDNQIDQATPIIGEQSLVTTSTMKRKRQTDLDSNDTTSPDVVIMNDDSTIKNKLPSINQSEGVDSEVSGMTDQAFSKTENLSHGKKVHNKQARSIELKTTAAGSSKKKGKLTKELKSLQVLTNGSEVNSFRTRSQKIMGKKDATKDVHQLTDVAKSDTKQPGAPLAPSTEADQEGSKGDAASVALKRKRGSPPRLLAFSPKTPAAVDHEICSNVPSTLFEVEAGQSEEVGLTTSSGTKSLKENQGPVGEQPVLAGKPNIQLNKDKLPNENTGQDLHVQPTQLKKRYSTRQRKLGKRQTVSINAESPAHVLGVDASEEKVDGSLEKDSTTEGKYSSVDGPEGTVEQSSKASEGWFESGNLPFIKSTALWNTLESMEAFRMLPQNPHFRPLLEGVKEGTQEGLAIATMVTFSTMVDKTRNLKIDDSRGTIEDCLETLVELENNGFDVKVIRERLTGLLLIKDKQEKVEELSKGVAEKIEENKTQGNSIKEEIEEISRQMRELEERRKQALLKNEKRISEMGVMEAVIEGIKHDMREVGAEFDRLAAAPFVV